MNREIENIFKKTYKNECNKTYFSPGRVNIIGEHIDYNGGKVFPVALTIGTYGAFSFRKDTVINAYSENFVRLGVKSFLLERVNDKDNSWIDFIKGVINELKKQGHEVTYGFDVAVIGNIPNGSGLSSSASLELLIATVLNDEFKFGMDMVELVKLCQKAENNYIGVNCGIMDQFAIGMGKKDNAILLDTATLDYIYVPFNMKGYSLLIMNTNKKRELSDSKYNERRAECDEAVEILKGSYDIINLCELSSDKLKDIEEKLDNETEFRRVRHVITENERVTLAVKALKENDINELGKLLTASHSSLRDDYEVTGRELDSIVTAALECEGVLGARMTGAGFGGCAIAIVEDSKVDKVIDYVKKEYKKETGLEGEFIIANTDDGTREI